MGLQPPSALASDTDASLSAVLQGFPEVVLALVFGSVAAGRARADSDLDLAVAAQQPLSAEQKMALTAALAVSTGRPVDLIDLHCAGEPLLGQIVRHGRRVLGSTAAHGAWISRHLIEQADFVPLRNRILKQRRDAWIGK